jgi:hypothetical protein
MADEDNNSEGTRLSFTTEQVQFGAFKLMMENNALLRLMLHNQQRIMTKLKLKGEFPVDVYKDLEQFMTGDTNNLRSENHVDRLAELVKQRLWEWVNLKLDISDPPKDEPG